MTIFIDYEEAIGKDKPPEMRFKGVMHKLKHLVKVDVRLICCQDKEQTRNYVANHAKWIRADNFVISGSTNWTFWGRQNNEIGTVVKLMTGEAKEYWDERIDKLLRIPWRRSKPIISQTKARTSDRPGYQDKFC